MRAERQVTIPFCSKRPSMINGWVIVLATSTTTEKVELDDFYAANEEVVYRRGDHFTDRARVRGIVH